jgi:hypothetical protein
MTHNILVVGTAPRLKKPALRAARGGNWYRGPLGPYFFRLWLDLFRRNDKFLPQRMFRASADQGSRSGPRIK